MRALSRGSNVIYGVSDYFKLDINAINKRSNIVHTNTIKTDFASVLVNMTPLLYHFKIDRKELYFKDRGNYIEIYNEENINSSLVQDGDTNEISTSDDEIQEQFSNAVIGVGFN